MTTTLVKTPQELTSALATALPGDQMRLAHGDWPGLALTNVKFEGPGVSILPDTGGDVRLNNLALTNCAGTNYPDAVGALDGF
jgi:hypothetical protein